MICNLGKVCELSANGMRIRARKLPRGILMIHLRGLGQELSVKGHVVWSRRKGLFMREAGIEFLEVTPTLSRQLTALGLTNRDQRAMG